MNYAKFQSDEPYDRLQRSLDTLHKMDFERRAVSVEITAPTLSSIQVTYEAKGRLMASTFFERSCQMADVENLNCG